MASKPPAAARRVEDLVQVVVALGGVLTLRRHVGGDKRPYIVVYSGWVELA